MNIQDTTCTKESPQTIPKVLLVEDYGPNILVATTFLDCFGYAYDTATNGIEALEKIEGGQYFAVLMDVQMYGMNGLEATAEVRKGEALAKKGRLHIIGMTAHAQTGDREKCIEAGMDDYLPKPFNPDELKEKLETAFEQYKQNEK